MNIGILGWGSLLWEGGPEFDRWHDAWAYDGPKLKLEFTRVSASRLGALTLVVDADHGTPTTVAWCRSKRTTLEDAAFDLSVREGTTLANIGQVIVAQTGYSEDLASIVTWARPHKLDAVIWTALRSNFNENGRPPFSTEAAVAYLKTLKPEAKAKAAEYVRRAPDFVKTPLRAKLEAEPWFPKRGS